MTIKQVFIGIIVFLIAFNTTVSLAISGPHMIYGTVEYTDGTVPTTIHFGAYVTSRPGEILTENSFDCGYQNGIWYVQCGNFPTAWSVGDILHVNLNDGGTYEGSIELILTTNVGDAGDEAGIILLTQPPNNIYISMVDTTIQRGSQILYPVFMDGIGLADSLVAYELTLGFDSGVLQAIGASSANTMTRNWGDPFVGPKTDTVRIAGFTTNQPSKRLFIGDGRLVNVNFLVHGIPSNPFSNSTIIHVVRADLYTLYDHIVVSHSKSGTITVQVNPTQVTKDLTLYPDWNQISLPLIPEDNTFPEVFEGIPVGYVRAYYNGENYKTWASGRPSWANDLHYMDGIHGYEMRLDTTVSMTLNSTGEDVAVNTPIILYEGWNLTGYLPTSVYQIAHALQSLDTFYTQIIEYKADVNDWNTWGRDRPPFANDLSELSPYLGYWIYMDGGGTLVYPSSPLLKITANNQQRRSKNHKTFIPKSCDFWAHQPDILTIGDSIHVIDIEGIICGKTAVLDQGGFLVHVFGDDPSTPDVDEGALDGEEIIFTINGQSTRVVGAAPDSKSPLELGNPCVWEDRESKQVLLELVETTQNSSEEMILPDEPRLAQNVPNPFNHQTVILYELPSPCTVSIQIFNAQGQIVTVLIDDHFMNSGLHRTGWDGRDLDDQRVSSGIYFYRLKAGHYSEIRKMILLY